MVGAEGVPDHDVLVLDGTVLLDPPDEPIVAGALVRVGAASVPLGGLVRGNPEMLAGETTALAHLGVLLSERENVGLRNQLVRHRLADPVLRGLVDDPPVADGLHVYVSSAVGLRLQLRGLRVVGVAMRVLFSRGHRLGVHLVDRVLLPVHVHVEAEVEEMLVDRPVEPLVVEELTVAGILPGPKRPGGDDPGQLALKLDGPVLVEVPEEAVLVVGHRRDEGDHEPAASTNLGLLAAHVEVLPQEAVVLLVHADGILDGERVPFAVGDYAVEVMDLSQAVTAELQGVSKCPDVVLARIKSVLAPLSRSGIAVGHHHLGERRPVEDGTLSAIVVVANRVEHEPLTRGKTYAEAPLLPAYLVSVNLEAGAFGLGDLQRLEVGPHLANILGPVVALLLRHGNHAGILDPDDLHLVEVYYRNEVIHWVGVGVVLGVEPYPGERPTETSSFLVAVAPRRPRVYEDKIHVRDAALPYRLLELRIPL